MQVYDHKSSQQSTDDSGVALETLYANDFYNPEEIVWQG